MNDGFKVCSCNIVTLNMKQMSTLIKTFIVQILIHPELYGLINDTHREIAPSNETPAFTKSKNMGILVVVQQIKSL